MSDAAVLIVTEEDTFLAIEDGETFIASVGEQGPPGPAGLPGASSGNLLMDRQNADLVVLTRCMAVSQRTNGTVERANANVEATKDVFGFVYDATIAVAGIGKVQVDGVFEAQTSEWDAVNGTSGGLVQDAYYFLDVSGGRIVPYPPSVDGQFVCRVGYAISTTKLQLRFEPTIKL